MKKPNCALIVVFFLLFLNLIFLFLQNIMQIVTKVFIINIHACIYYCHRLVLIRKEKTQREKEQCAIVIMT
ncbi:unnamed protein product [Phytomonas sp. Hart1]|nr:unnamed protein product [Phytomonas sp. Hart1]|eukprot:CCW68909.1 unnamed protein product [Phytomonas sp. isolate Hart1]